MFWPLLSICLHISFWQFHIQIVGGTVKFLDGQAGKTFGTQDELLEGRPFSDLILTDPMNSFVAPGKLPEIDILPESVGVGDLILGPKMDEARKAIGDTREGIVSGFSRKADEDTLEAIETLSPGLTTRANIDALTDRLKDQTAVEDVLERLKESVDLTGHNSRMLVDMEELDPGVTRWEAAGEALYGASTIMTLGGTADIREGIEEGDPVKVTMGVFQTVSMLALVGAAGSSIKAGGLKLIGAIDDVAYKEAMTLAKTAMTAGEAIDAISGGVQALEGIATGNPLAAIAGLASIGMADLPPGATKKVIGEVVEEGLEKVTKEAVEELTEEGVEKVAREAVEDVTEEAIEHTTREAVEQATGQTVKDVAEEAREAAGKQTDEVREVLPKQGFIGEPEAPSYSITPDTGTGASKYAEDTISGNKGPIPALEKHGPPLTMEEFTERWNKEGLDYLLGSSVMPDGKVIDHYQQVSDYIINPHWTDVNCPACVTATDALLKGRPASALPELPDNLKKPAAILHRFGVPEFDELFDDPNRVLSIMKDKGNGTIGTITMLPRMGLELRLDGHTANLVMHRGEVYLLDSQFGMIKVGTAITEFLERAYPNDKFIYGIIDTTHTGTPLGY